MMLRRLSGGLRRVSTGPVVFVALILFLLFTALVLPRQSRSAKALGGGAGSPDTSFFYTAGNLYHMAEAYGLAGRAAYVRARFTFDVIWPLVYTVFLVTAISWTFVRAFPPDSRWQRANLVPLLAALFDLLENVSTSLVMARYPAPTPVAAVLAPIFTAAKWLFVTASFVLLLVGAVAAARRRILAACVLVALLGMGLAPGPHVSAAGHPFRVEGAADVAAPRVTTAPAVVTVTNTTDTVDGDTTDIAALAANPGPDGTISFREALTAANGTSGTKRIGFAPALTGGRIVFAAKSDLLTLSAGDLTIDGDTDDDGQPDIALDGSALAVDPPMPGLIIDSSHNTITGLALEEFGGSAIFMTCLRAGCAPKLFADNRVISNTVSTSRGTLPLISLTPMGILPIEEMPGVSDVLWQDIDITGNTITSTSPDLWQAIGITASQGGGSRNRISDFSHVGIQLMGANAGGAVSTTSANSLSDILVTGNRIEQVKQAGQGSGIQIFGAWSETVAAEQNTVTGVHLIRNEIIRTWSGVEVIGGSGAGSQGNTARVPCPAGNRLTDVSTPWDVRNDVDGASGNLAQVTWCSYLPLLLR